MICLNCDCEEFEVKAAHFDPEINGVKVDVIVPAYVCSKCQTPLMDGEQMNVLRETALEQYRKLNS